VDATRRHTELVADLVEQVRVRLVDPLVVLLDGDEPVRALADRIRIDAEMWAAQLLGPDESRAVRTATRLVAALYPGDAAFDPPAAWWATPFGRVVLQRIGHPGRERVTYAVAGAMLGISRQGVHDLLNRGKLAAHPDGGVSTASVRARATRRSASTEVDDVRN
jgi:hypothetical protein